MSIGKFYCDKCHRHDGTHEKNCEYLLRSTFEKNLGGVNILADFRKNKDGSYYNPHTESEWQSFIALKDEV